MKGVPGVMRRVSPDLISAIEELRKKHDLKMHFTEMTGVVAKSIKERESSIMDKVPNARKKRIQWY